MPVIQPVFTHLAEMSRIYYSTNLKYSLLSTGYRGLLPGVKRPGREADHSPPYGDEFKNAWSYTSTPPIRIHGVVLS